MFGSVHVLLLLFFFFVAGFLGIYFLNLVYFSHVQSSSLSRSITNSHPYLYLQIHVLVQLGWALWVPTCATSCLICNGCRYACAFFSFRCLIWIWLKFICMFRSVCIDFTFSIRALKCLCLAFVLVLYGVTLFCYIKYEKKSREERWIV